MKAIWILVVVCSLLLRGVGGADEGMIRYECQVFRLNGNFEKKTSLRSSIWAGSEADWEKISGEITLFDSGEFEIGENTLKIGRKGCYWDDFKLTFEEGFRAELPEERIKMILSPDLLRKDNELVRMKIESSQPFQFMSPRGEGGFELNEVTLPVGMDIHIQASSEEDENALLISNLEIELRLVNRREAVEGTRLPVGKPVLDTFKYRMKLKVREDTNYGILIQPKGSQAAIVVRIEMEDQ